MLPFFFKGFFQGIQAKRKGIGRATTTLKKTREGGSIPMRSQAEHTSREALKKTREKIREAALIKDFNRQIFLFFFLLKETTRLKSSCFFLVAFFLRDTTLKKTRE